MHTDIDKQVIGRFFTAIDALVERNEIKSIQSYCLSFGFDFQKVYALRKQNSTYSLHFDWIIPLIMDFGVSSLWLTTGLGDMFMPMYKTDGKVA